MSQYTSAPVVSAPNIDATNGSSPQAEAARQRAAEVMAALKNGAPGEADALMKPKTVPGPTEEVHGSLKPKGGSRREHGGFLARLLGTKKLKGEKLGEDGVVR
jgi:hypothetical protein